MTLLTVHQRSATDPRSNHERPDEPPRALGTLPALPLHSPSIDLTLRRQQDDFDEAFLARMQPLVEKAFADMDALERARSSTGRAPDGRPLTGSHPELAPDPEIRKEIPATVAAIKAFRERSPLGQDQAAEGPKFNPVISIGIGGSRARPGSWRRPGDPSTDKMELHFVDNTDPTASTRLRRLAADRRAVTLVMSKSGGTPEPYNGMVLVSAAYARRLDFPSTPCRDDGRLEAGQARRLSRLIARFPMWDWVGGRTSELSAVASSRVPPGVRHGGDARRGPRLRRRDPRARHAQEPCRDDGPGVAPRHRRQGQKDMVVLPYKDRLLMFSRYLQQLLMGVARKRYDLNGNRVDQGISVYGKQGLDRPARLRASSSATAVNKLLRRVRAGARVGRRRHAGRAGSDAGDYLHGFLLGTREALFGNDRSRSRSPSGRSTRGRSAS